MKLEWTKEFFSFTEIDPVVSDLLQRMPECAIADDEAARRRIFPRPTGGQEEETDADWRDHVEPELQELFASHLEVVSNDLQPLRAGAEIDHLEIPAKHVGAWVHALNQARLALGERHGLTEQHLNFGTMPEKQEDAMAMVQVEFYGFLLSFLLRHTEL